MVNLVSSQSIEERMLDVIKFKSSLFSGVLDNGEDQIFMGESKFKRFMQSIEEVAVPVQTAPVPVTEEERETRDGAISKYGIQTSIQPPTSEFFTAAESFLGTLSKILADKQKTEQLVSSFIEKHSQTGKSYIKIPVENQEVINKAVDAFTGFLSLLKRP